MGVTNYFVYYATNSGTNWAAQVSGCTTILNSVFFINATTIGYAVGDSSTILKTINGGTNWTILNSGITGGYVNLKSVYFTDVNTGYAVGQSGKIIKTTNGGTNWVAQSSGVTNDIFSIYFINANTGYAVGWTKVLKTTNGGSSWTVQSSGITGTYDNLNDVYFIDANTGYTVGNKGRILKTINGGGVGIEENTANNSIQIYPNPASDFITIDLQNINNEVKLNIYNVMGDLLRSENISKNHQTLNIQNLADGMYVASIESNNKIITQKFIIQR